MKPGLFAVRVTKTAWTAPAEADTFFGPFWYEEHAAQWAREKPGDGYKGEVCRIESPPSEDA